MEICVQTRKKREGVSTHLVSLLEAYYYYTRSVMNIYGNFSLSNFNNLTKTEWRKVKGRLIGAKRTS